MSAQEARAAAPRRVREFHEPFFGRGAGCAGEEDWDFAGEEELPCPQHAIEQIDESLIHNLRERLPHGLAQDRVVANQLIIRVVHQLEDVLLPSQNGEKGRCLLEDVLQARTFELKHFEQAIALDL